MKPEEKWIIRNELVVCERAMVTSIRMIEVAIQEKDWNTVEFYLGNLAYWSNRRGKLN